MADTWKLNTNVHVVERDSKGGLTGRAETFGPADEVPDWAVVAISNPDVWESQGSRSKLPPAPDPKPDSVQRGGNGDELPPDIAAAIAALRAEAASLRDQVFRLQSGGDTKPDPAIPPKGGAGSGAPVWREYAASKGVSVADDASREDVIAALDAANVPTE